ncbi:MAG: YabP/YqfC family sporulation protein [Oscillospiraceae bacterium]
MNREFFDKKIRELDNRLPKGDTLVQISNNEEVVIEGCIGVEEYDENIICLRLTKQKAVISGTDLQMETYLSGLVAIRGRIHSVEFDGE